MFSEHYKLLSIIFSYPEDEKLLRESCGKLVKLSKGVQDLNELEEFVRGSPISAIQEEYVTTFELQPVCAPYIAHHIYGESYKKGEYMIFLKEVYRQNSFIPSINDLPDHVAIVSEFLSVFSKDRAEFIRNIMPGVEKMKETVESEKTPYRQAVLLFHKLCSLEISEVEEVIECSIC